MQKSSPRGSGTGCPGFPPTVKPWPFCGATPAARDKSGLSALAAARPGSLPTRRAISLTWPGRRTPGGWSIAPTWTRTRRRPTAQTPAGPGSALPGASSTATTAWAGGATPISTCLSLMRRTGLPANLPMAIGTTCCRRGRPTGKGLRSLPDVRTTGTPVPRPRLTWWLPITQLANPTPRSYGLRGWTVWARWPGPPTGNGYWPPAPLLAMGWACGKAGSTSWSRGNHPTN